MKTQFNITSMKWDLERYTSVEDFATALEGFDGVELESSLLKNADRQTVACHLKELGLEVCSIRSPFARTGYGLEDMIAEAKAVAAKARKMK